MSKIFYIDVETTGVDSSKHAMVQFSGIIEIDGQEKERVDILTSPFPGDLVSKEALEVIGKTIDQLREYPDAKESYRQLLDVTGKYVDKFNRADKFYFIGYNSRFDEDFVRAWFRKCNDNYFGSWFYWPTIDVSNLAAIHFMQNGGRPDSFKLMSVAAALGIEVDEDLAHDAMYDIIITKKIFETLTHNGETL